MGGRYQLGEVCLRLWIEIAHSSLIRAGEDECGDVVRTLQTEDQFFVILASGPGGGAEGQAQAARVADLAASMLTRGTSPEAAVQAVLPALPGGEHVPFSILQVVGGCRAYLVECDAPPLFLTRGGELVLLPVLEDEARGRLIRTCRFLLEDGDHVAMVSEGYIRARGWSRPWSWRDIAISTRRWTETRGDAEQLLGALIRTYRRLAEAEPEQDVTVVAMQVRPMRTATVWTGPPADPALDEAALRRLMAEPVARVICGDTTAEIAARLLGATLEMEPRPEGGWADVPPVSRLAGLSLVTEGLVTMTRAREWMAGVKGVRDLPRGDDGAARLARVLLTADRVHFVVGLAVNPAQAADAAGAIPLRRLVTDDLLRELRVRGKLVSAEYL